jgi:hypothetical protein
MVRGAECRGPGMGDFYPMSSVRPRKGRTPSTVIPKRSLARGISRDATALNALSRLFYQEPLLANVSITGSAQETSAEVMVKEPYRLQLRLTYRGRSLAEDRFGMTVFIWLNDPFGGGGREIPRAKERFGMTSA